MRLVLLKCYIESEEDSNQPLYMCIKIGKKFNLVPAHGGTFVRTRLKAEYWFDIPPDRYIIFSLLLLFWFDTVPACDGQTDRQTDEFTVDSTALCIASYADAL